MCSLYSNQSIIIIHSLFYLIFYRLQVFINYLHKIFTIIYLLKFYSTNVTHVNKFFFFFVNNNNTMILIAGNIHRIKDWGKNVNQFLEGIRNMF